MLCKYCNKDYADDFFHVALTTDTKVYRRKKCKFCYSKTKHNYHNLKRDKYTEFKKTLKCCRCGFSNYKALQFHHHNEDKFLSVSAMVRSYSMDRIKEEILKCEVLCANCHFIEHYNDFKIVDVGSNPI